MSENYIAKEANLSTLLEAIIKISEAQIAGRTLAGQVGPIRFNSADALSPQDVEKLAHEALHQVNSLKVAFDILWKKAKPFHVSENLPEETFEIRENMWYEVLKYLRLK